VCNTVVEKNQKYMVVRWMELVPGSGGQGNMQYYVSAVEDCISGPRALSVLTVKPRKCLGAVKSIPSLDNSGAQVRYTLQKTTREKVLALLRLF
jgi:hypothetical protein